ncbi:MAG: vWA domain-containing protein [Patescibacteria group bacterium]
MKRKILSGAVALAVGVAILPLFAAFEAHVINVTAKIENALNVPLGYLDFGTVFPQEHLDKSLDINLSQSFLDENRVDDVSYIIRQKPKCAITTLGGTSFDATLDQDGKNHLYTGTGHVVVGDNPATDAVETSWVNCGPAPRELAQGETWGALPMLCPYISKHPDGKDDQDATNTVGALNDGHMDSFHKPWSIIENGIVWNDTKGHLAKSQKDTKDLWTIDLAVPCFGGYCAQDWEEFVHGINPDANPAAYTQPIANEHKIFGCDLWVEVTGISLPGLGCNKKIDLMLVVDRSGSIGSTNMAAVRTALKAFVDALVLALDGPHAGQSSFASLGTLDQVLTDDEVLVKAAIDTLVSSGSTNMTAGINEAKLELESIRDRADAPDFMVIVTDGIPNVCADGSCSAGEADAEALAAATAAKAAGIEIYVVGVGSGVDADYLKTIASGEDHYFAGDFGTLNTTLADIVNCED